MEQVTKVRQLLELDVGATNPNDNAWVAGVLGLDSTYFTNATAGSTPSWIEGIGSNKMTFGTGPALGIGTGAGMTLY